MIALQKHLVKEFFWLCRERHQIYLRRQAGGSPPFTMDLLLQRYHFCNVFRNLDATTAYWLGWRRRYKGADLLFASVAYRLLNTPAAFHRLDQEGLLRCWQPDRALDTLENVKLNTQAYKIHTQDGLFSRAGICKILAGVRERGPELLEVLSNGPGTLEHTTWLFAGIPFVGPFKAYQMALDLKGTSLLPDPPDAMTWAFPGPGAQRGAMLLQGLEFERGWIADRNTKLRKTVGEGAENCIKIMRTLLRKSQEEANWPADWQKWEIGESEHMLCEWDKYTRKRDMDTGGRLFKPGRNHI